MSPSIHEIIEAQRNYFRSGATKQLQHRKQQLLNLRNCLEYDMDTLTDAVYSDMKRSSKTTKGMELFMVFGEIDYMISNLNQWTSPQHVKKSLTCAIDSVFTVREPLGVVLIFSAYNYPLFLSLLPITAAIAAGNTVVLKTSERSPNSSVALFNVLSRHFDSSFLAVVNGDVDTSKALLAERFDHIFFTGSTAVANQILSAAAKNITPVTLELGGKCPVVVESDADIYVTAKRIAWGKWTNCGQTCLSPDYVLVKSDVSSDLVEAFIKVLNQFYSPNARESPEYSRIVDEAHYKNLAKLLKQSSAEILYEGGKWDIRELFIPPMIVHAEKDDAFLENEIFGPILPIVTVEDFDDAIKFINSKPKPLSAYLFTRSKSKMRRFVNETSSGSVCVNDVCVQLSVPTLPFGGVGDSGMGRYRGKYGFETFTHEKSVMLRPLFGEFLFSARYAPMTESKVMLLRFLTGNIAIPDWTLKICKILFVLLIGYIVGVLTERFSRY